MLRHMTILLGGPAMSYHPGLRLLPQLPAPDPEKTTRSRARPCQITSPATPSGTVRAAAGNLLDLREGKGGVADQLRIEHRARHAGAVERLVARSRPSSARILATCFSWTALCSEPAW